MLQLVGICSLQSHHESIKDTHSEKAPPNKTPELTKSTNLGIWVVDTTNQRYIRGS